MPEYTGSGTTRCAGGHLRWNRHVHAANPEEAKEKLDEACNGSRETLHTIHTDVSWALSGALRGTRVWSSERGFTNR